MYGRAGRLGFAGPPRHPQARPALLHPAAQHFAGRPVADTEHRLGAQAFRGGGVAKHHIVSRDHPRDQPGAKPHRRGGVGQHGPAQPARDLPHLRAESLRIRGLHRPHHDRAVHVRLQRRHRHDLQRRLGRDQMGEERIPIDLRGHAGRRPVIRQRRQRIPERKVQVHRSGDGTERPLHGLRHRLPEVTQSRLGRFRHGELVEKDGVVAEEPRLVDGLSRCAVPQLGRAIGRKHDQRYAGLARLDHRREIMRRGRTAGAEQRHRPPGLLREPQSEKTRRSFVHHRDRLEPAMRRRGHRHRRRAGTGGDHHSPHAAADERLHQHPRPEGVHIARIRDEGIHDDVGAPIAPSMALNLSSVSANSFSGVEPATMPAPA